MQVVLLYIVRALIYAISYLPFGVLYKISDVLFFIMFYVIRYRRKVVQQNLRNAFPEKSEAERNQIERAFFSFLADLFIETIKGFTISKEELHKRCVYVNLDITETLYKNNTSCIMVLGHYGNWEWAGQSFKTYTNYPAYIIYKPLNSKPFDTLIYNMRSRLGLKLIAMNNVYKDMLQLRGQAALTAFIADQTPHPEFAYWTTFLHQDTPVFPGTEKVARKFNYPVVYATIKRIKRGYYTVTFEVLSENPKATVDGEISELHTRKLEADIHKQPEIWLWSHKRWKYKRPDKLPSRTPTRENLQKTKSL